MCPGETPDALRAAMTAAEALPPKERRHKGRTLGHMAMVLENSGALTTIADMDLAIRALTIGASVHTYPQKYHLTRARLMLARRALLGQSEPVIALEKAATLDIEAGGLTLEDAGEPPAGWHAGQNFTDWMAQTGCFFVSFGGDGWVKVRLRVHASGPVEPQAREFRRLREATAETVLRLPSGRLRAHGGGAKAVTLAPGAGEWRVAAYGLGIGRAPECLVLMSPLEGAAPHPLVDTPELRL